MYFRHFVSSYIGGKKAMTHTPEERLETSLLSKMGAHSRTRKPCNSSYRNWPKCTIEAKNGRTFGDHLSGAGKNKLTILLFDCASEKKFMQISKAIQAKV